MKIQCSSCEVAEAKVLCCADEAALCLSCDHKIHTANKLATKHQRVPLTASSSKMPKCDICQETVGYFFCLEDRALLCRKCDVAIHTVNSLVSTHSRFLLTGVKVGLEATELGSSSSSGKKRSISSEKISEPLPKRKTSTDHCCINSPVKGSSGADFSPPKITFAGDAATGSVSPLPLDEFLAFDDLNQYYNIIDNGTSKADSGKLGDSDCFPILGAADLELDSDERLGQVSDSHWAVPRVVSPPTASGIYWPKNYQHLPDSPVFVPDVGSSTFQNFHHTCHVTKRPQCSRDSCCCLLLS